MSVHNRGNVFYGAGCASGMFEQTAQLFVVATDFLWQWEDRRMLQEASDLGQAITTSRIESARGHSLASRTRTEAFSEDVQTCPRSDQGEVGAVLCATTEVHELMPVSPDHAKTGCEVVQNGTGE